MAGLLQPWFEVHFVKEGSSFSHLQQAASSYQGAIRTTETQRDKESSLTA